MSDTTITNIGGFIVEPDTPEERTTFINDKSGDIQQKTIVRLGRYMSDLTHGKVGSVKQANAYAIDDNISFSSIQTSTGTPTKLSDSQNSERFVKSSQDINLAIDNTLKEPEPAKIGLNDVWQKGVYKSRPNVQNGNELLQNADDNNSPIKKITSAVLANNRFNSDKQMNPDFIDGPKARYNPTVRIPQNNLSLGTHNTIDTFADDSFDKLALIGYILSLRASNEGDSNEDGFNPLTAGAEADALLPTFNQMAVERINTATLRAKDVYQKMKNTKIDDANIINISQNSWGTMNNMYDQFTGMSAVGMPALAMSLIATVLGALELLGAAVSLVAPAPVNAPTKHPDGRYVFGKWSTTLTGKGSSSTLSIDFPPPISDTLGIKSTQYPFMKALNKGMFLFFGMDTSKGIVGTIVDGINQSLDSPGYNAVVCRAILRSSLTIIDQIKETTKSSNLISGAKNVLDLLQSIKSSKLMAAINIFTDLGDRALAEIDSAHIIDHDGIIYNSEIDFFENNMPGASVSKSKLNGSMKLAWANNRTPSMFLMPSTVLGLSIASISGQDKNQLGAPLQHTLRAESQSKNETVVIEPKDSTLGSNMRIPQTTTDDNQLSVEKMEQLLDSEYMPFYFHDLRTNEIISFHAFLNSLTEDFQPQWESSEGYGRVDKIKIYKSTDRRITFSFWIASTSKNDFDDMWVKINKLVTLVYPQYSAGRKISPENYHFTMPFSQHITSSPVIRLRIGDLVRSNYSKFNLSRVFGMTDYDSPQVGANGKLDFSQTYNNFLTIKQKFESLMKEPWQGSTYKWYIVGPDNMNVPTEGASINVPIPAAISEDKGNPVPLKIPQHLLKFYNVKPLRKYDPSGGSFGVSIGVSMGSSNSSNNADDIVVQGIFELTPMTALEIADNWNLSSAQAGAIEVQLIKFEQKGKNNQKTKDRQFVLPANAVQLQPISVRQFWIDNSTSTSAGMTELLTFMSAKNNAIVRSFQETGGKGLAGVIESLNFDWLDNTQWEIDQTRRAPTRVKVNIGFAPIHDISPGLDHMGYNRSPIYPVAGMFSELIRDKD